MQESSIEPKNDKNKSLEVALAIFKRLKIPHKFGYPLVLVFALLSDDFVDRIAFLEPYVEMSRNWLRDVEAREINGLQEQEINELKSVISEIDSRETLLEDRIKSLESGLDELNRYKELLSIHFSEIEFSKASEDSETDLPFK